MLGCQCVLESGPVMNNVLFEQGYAQNSDYTNEIVTTHRPKCTEVNPVGGAIRTSGFLLACFDLLAVHSY